MGASALGLAASPALAQAPATVLTSAELYSGEKALYEAAVKEGMVISNNTGPTWANWAALFRVFGQRYPNISLVYNDVGSGVAVNALERTKARPQVDTIYYFGANGVDAQKRGLLAPFTPTNFEKLPALAKHPAGEWFTIHQLEIVFIVNKKLVKNVPKSFADLAKPEYKGNIVYLDPRSTGVGQVLTWAANFAKGGTYTNLEPGLKLIEQLHKSGNVLRVMGTTPYAQFVKGEIPIWVNFVNDGLRAKFLDGMGDDVEIVSPSEGTVAAPYTISLVKNGPNPNAAKLWLNFIMSDRGQELFAEGFVTPSVPGVALSEAVRLKLVKHEKSTLLDLGQSAAQLQALQAGWAKAAL
ncbi:MAG: extracellular solute-binding protein [Rhizobiales bacterium]|nr:extracellular solute-binding protein [Hyphomicrobiales bacterium]